MCFVAPGKIIEIKDGKAIVDYGGIRREADMSFMELSIGDYVIMSAGFVVEKLDQQKAKEFLEMMSG